MRRKTEAGFDNENGNCHPLRGLKTESEKEGRKNRSGYRHTRLGLKTESEKKGKEKTKRIQPPLMGTENRWHQEGGLKIEGEKKGLKTEGDFDNESGYRHHQEGMKTEGDILKTEIWFRITEVGRSEGVVLLQKLLWTAKFSIFLSEPRLRLQIFLARTVRRRFLPPILISQTHPRFPCPG